MFLALLITLLVTLCGTFATYFYDDDAPLPVRWAMGACTGLTAWGLLAFVLASFIGLTPLSIALATFILLDATVLAAWRNASHRRAAQADLQAAWYALTNPTRRTTLYAIYCTGLGLLLWRIFDRAVMTMPDGGLGTGIQNNFGDLPFHLSVATGFAYGQNYPPMDPTYAGIKFTYPFITDFISAIYLNLGADFVGAFWVENIVLAIALVILLHHWTYRLTGNDLAARLAPFLVLFSGGLGWLTLLNQARASESGLFGLLGTLKQTNTIGADILRWGNSVTTLFVPQRGFLLGLPLALMVFALLWKLTAETQSAQAVSEAKEETEFTPGPETSITNAALTAPTTIEPLTAPQSSVAPTKNKAKKAKVKNTNAPTSAPVVARQAWRDVPRPTVSNYAIAIGAGVAAALLPLAHAHTYVTVMLVSGLIFLLLGWQQWRAWFVFFGVAVLVAAPQMLWATQGSAVQAQQFYAVKFGWDKPEDIGIVWFWFKNTGFFIPLTLAALVWHSGGKPLLSRRTVYFLLPFMVCFILGNTLQMAPWIWDNIKVMFYWWVGSVPLVAALVAHLWQKRELAWRAAAVIALFVVTAAGALDVWAVVNGATNTGIYDRGGLAFAEVVRAKTPPRALIVHAPTHLTPIFLTGRQSLMGYPGHIWSHGISPAEREGDIRSIYSGTPDAERLLAKYGVQYVTVGPLERELPGFNEAFWARYPVAAESGTYRLYQIK